VLSVALPLQDTKRDFFYAQHGAEENKVNNGTDSGHVATLFQRLRSDRMTVGLTICPYWHVPRLVPLCDLHQKVAPL
jgi:hypothetical protein